MLQHNVLHSTDIFSVYPVFGRRPYKVLHYVNHPQRGGPYGFVLERSGCVGCGVVLRKEAKKEGLSFEKKIQVHHAKSSPGSALEREWPPQDGRLVHFCMRLPSVSLLLLHLSSVP
jgi:hypothetical protein